MFREHRKFHYKNVLFFCGMLAGDSIKIFEFKWVVLNKHSCLTVILGFCIPRLVTDSFVFRLS